MHMLKDERLAQHQPTQYPTSEASLDSVHAVTRALFGWLCTCVNECYGMLTSTHQPMRITLKVTR